MDKEFIKRLWWRVYL